MPAQRRRAPPRPRHAVRPGWPRLGGHREFEARLSWSRTEAAGSVCSSLSSTGQRRRSRGDSAPAGGDKLSRGEKRNARLLLAQMHLDAKRPSAANLSSTPSSKKTREIKRRSPSPTCGAKRGRGRLGRERAAIKAMVSVRSLVCPSSRASPRRA